MFRKSITALTTAAIVSTSAVTPAFAGETENNIAKFLAGALVLYAIKEAAENKNARTVTHAPVQKTQATKAQRQQARKAQRQQERQAQRQQQRQQERQARKTVPAKCVFRYVTAEGNRTLAHKGCLQKHYRYVSRLPQHCERKLFTSRGWRIGFAKKCLSQTGFKIG